MSYRYVLEKHECGRYSVRDYNEATPADIQGFNWPRLNDALCDLLVRATARDAAERIASRKQAKLPLTS